MAYSEDPEQPKIRIGTRSNPRITDGVTTIETTYPPNNTSPLLGSNENASFQQTLGGEERKQADAWTRSVEIRWLEPGDFVVSQLLQIWRGGGNRARNALTYVHHRKIFSQLGDGVESEFEPNHGRLIGFIRNFVPRETGKRTETGLIWYRCVLQFQEGKEVQP